MSFLPAACRRLPAACRLPPGAARCNLGALPRIIACPQHLSACSDSPFLNDRYFGSGFVSDDDRVSLQSLLFATPTSRGAPLPGRALPVRQRRLGLVTARYVLACALFLCSQGTGQKPHLSPFPPARTRTPAGVSEVRRSLAKLPGGAALAAASAAPALRRTLSTPRSSVDTNQDAYFAEATPRFALRAGPRATIYYQPRASTTPCPCPPARPPIGVPGQQQHA